MDPIRMPAYTDEPIASVLRVLQLQPLHGATEHTVSFTGTSLPQERRRVYGGQVLAQMMLAAGATVPADREIHCLQAAFLRAGVFSEDLAFDVDLAFDGRSFSSRGVQARQSGGTICSGNCSFQVRQPGLEHRQAMPPATGPEGLASNLEVFREIRTPVAKYLGKTTAFEVRHVEENLYFKPSSLDTNTQMLWLRPRLKLPADMSQLVHRALLAYIADQVMLEPVLRANHLHWATEGMSLATLNHTQYFFDTVNINQWHLFVGSSPVSAGSRGVAHCDVFNETGQQVSTIMQEGMIRVPSRQGEAPA